VATGNSILCSTKRSRRGHFALAAGPFRERGVQTLARHDQRSQQGDAFAAMFLEQSRGDGVRGLRLDARFANRTVLHPQLHIQQAQEMIDLGERRHRALASTAAGALLNGHRRRDAENRIDIRTRGRLHELPGIGVQ
jgi:hypothetical protein